MRVTFCAPSARRPIGGVIALYEFANGLSRRGHEVHVVHLPGVPDRLVRVADIDFFEFEPAIEHIVCETFDEAGLPESDFVELTAPAFFSDSPPATPAPGAVSRTGLPFVFVQGFDYLPKDAERRAFALSCPKICIARWLVSAVAGTGVPAEQLAYVPYGLDHETFRLTAPIEGRPRQVTMLCHRHPVKGTRFGIAALEEVQRRDPRVQVVLFGVTEPSVTIPAGMSYVQSPARDALVRDIYNTSRVFLCASLREGFGFCAIEAMAGGCALVTTSNGGSDDYAIEGDTALVVEPRDVPAMADRIEQLLSDDDLRRGIATRGLDFVQRFDWDESARELEAFLEGYGANPSAHSAATQRD